MSKNTNNEGRSTIFFGLQIAFLVLLLALIVPKLFGDRKSDTDFEAMKEGVTSVAVMDGMDEASEQTIKRFYSLNAKDYEGIALYIPNTAMGVDEILLVKTDNEDQKKAVEAAVQTRLSAQKSNFDGYGVNQTELLENAVIDVKGNYILYVVGENASEIDDKFVELY